jgi:sugar phosphate isomerase/epimerase
MAPSTDPSVSRRRLFAASAATAVGTALATSFPATAGPATGRRDLPAKRIGIQMYTMREQVARLGFRKVLRRVADIGFKEIEFAGFADGGLRLPELRRVLAEQGLRPIGNHGGMDDASLRAAEVLELPYTGVGILTNLHGTTTDAWKQTADELNAFGRRARRAGTRFYVHIHGPEYLTVTDAPGTYALDVLLEHTDPRYVFWEMDIYWAYFFASYVGASGELFDPTDWVRRHRKRFPLFHVKDGRTAIEAQADTHQLALMWNPTGGAGQLPFEDGITDVGQGDIDFHRFLGALEDVDAHHYIWERDTANDAPKGEFTAARASYLMMRHDEMARRIGR